MKKGLTELVFILDRSGSMGGLESDTIGGFNGMLMKQKKEEGEANVTTVLFDDQIEVIHDRFPIDVVKPLTDEDYYVRGCTALLDAVGSTVKKVENIQNRLPEELRAEKIIFVITTDGQENASQEYSANMVKKMIEKNQEKGWQYQSSSKSPSRTWIFIMPASISVSITTSGIAGIRRILPSSPLMWYTSFAPVKLTSQSLP